MPGLEEPCGFIFISFTHLFSLTHRNDCPRLQVCLQLWEFPSSNYSLHWHLYRRPSSNAASASVDLILATRLRSRARAANPQLDHKIHNILLASALINCPPSCLPPYIHPPSYPPPPHLPSETPLQTGLQPYRKLHRPTTGLCLRGFGSLLVHIPPSRAQWFQLVDTGYCPALTFLCVSVHVVHNSTLYSENAVKIMLEGEFNHWIMYHSVQHYPLPSIAIVPNGNTKPREQCNVKANLLCWTVIIGCWSREGGSNWMQMCACVSQ